MNSAETKIDRAMSESKYQLILSGQLIDGFDYEEAVSNLGHLLKLPDEQVRKLLQGEKSHIRKLLDHEKAEHLRQKLVDRGVECSIEAVSLDQVAPVHRQESRPEPSGAEPSPPAATEDLSLDFDLSDLPSSADTREPSLDNEQAKPAKASSGELELVAIEEESAEVDETSPEERSEREEIVLETAPVQSTPVVIIEPEKTEKSGKPADPDSELNKGTFFDQPNVVKPTALARASAGSNRTLLLVGGALMLLGVIWLALPYITGESDEAVAVNSKATAEPEIAVPVDPQLAATNKNLNLIFSSVRVWMIQFGAGFDPSQVTLERLSQDLALTQEQMVDGWGQAFRYVVDNPHYRVISAGPDGQFDSADDIVKKGNALQK
jgi:hypothetical protein